MVLKTSSYATSSVAALFILCGCICLDHVSAGVFRQRSTQMEWYDPMDDVTEADYYALNDAIVARKPFQWWDKLRPGRATTSHSCNHVRAVPSELRKASHMKPIGLTTFYQKYTEAYGIPIVASSRVADNALKRACYVTRFLFADHSRVRQSYYARYGRIAVIGANENTTDIPENSHLSSYWNKRARGFGATNRQPACSCGEENILCYSNDPWHYSDILLHEVAHGVDILGARYAIPDWEARLESVFQSAKSSGKWANTYSMTNNREYFAEGTRSFFDSKPYSEKPNGVHNSINTQRKLRSYDPGLFQLVSEIFPCNNTYLKRCVTTPKQEMAQQLKMNCDLDKRSDTTENSD